MGKPLLPLIEEHAPTASPTVSLRRGLMLVVLIFLLTRLVIWTGAYTGKFIQFRLHHGFDPPIEKKENQTRLAEIFAELNGQEPLKSKEAIWVRDYIWDLGPLIYYDARWYRDIVVEGYDFKEWHDTEEEHPYNIAFFPLYPMICKGATDWVLFPALKPTTLVEKRAIANYVMVTIAHQATLLSAILLYLWLRTRLGHFPGLLATSCFLCWPATCYTAFGYAECITALLFIVICICLDKKWFWRAAIVCAFATASRPTAICMVPVIALMSMVNDKGSLSRRFANMIPFAVVGGLGLAAYACYLWWDFGSPFVYSQNFRQGWVTTEDRLDTLHFLLGERVWNQTFYIGRAIRDFPLGLMKLTDSRTWNMPSVWFILLVSVGAWKRVPKSFRPMLLLGPFVFLQSYLASGGADFGVTPIGRYMGMAIPAFVVMGAWLAKEWRASARGFFFIVLVMLLYIWSYQFGLGEWPG